jgi:predicted RNA-binding protein with RPS1 domain
LNDSGAFVKMPNGLEGFIHISEIPGSKTAKVEELLKVGQKSPFTVIRTSSDEHKIALSLKPAAGAVPEEAPKREGRPAKESRERASKKEEASVSTKPKSQLQLELEKHAARLQEQDQKSEEGS